MAWDWRWGSGFPERRPPRKAKGGIKASSKRGAFGQEWWSRRWLLALERFTPPGRLARGRTYARKGQVLSLELAGGKIESRVQGSRPKPYKVTIAAAQLEPGTWDVIVKELGARPALVARLLAGELPEEIERVFEEKGLSLFPAKRADLWTDCTCPDAANTCKHVAAVISLLGEELDRDPFRLLALRGLERDELIARLPGPSGDEAEAPPEEPEPLDPRKFWGAPLPPLALGAIVEPTIAAPLARTLGPFPLWRGARPLGEVMESLTRAAARAAIEELR